MVLILVGLAVFISSVAYRNPQKPHRRTPAEYDIPFTEVYIPTNNQRHLYGWWIPAQNPGSEPPPTLVLVHGWGRNVARMLGFIRELHPQGYNLLAFDARSHGSSDYDGTATMVKFAEDICAAIDYLVLLPNIDPEQIGVIGLSIGGSSAIYAASLDSRIKCVVTMGAFAHPGDIIRIEFKKRHIPYFPLVWLMILYIQLRIGKSFNKIAPENVIPNIPARIFIIHGEDDLIVPLEHGQRLYAAGDPRRVRFWQVPGKGHSDCPDHPEFWQKVSAFLEEAFEMEEE
ncbi:MAG: alpha/beta fold hydrolase [FCB group bacterium]|nr:alpha/beta fold hydrolase [FCB group bacterium]